MDEKIHRLKENPGKKLVISVEGVRYARYPIKTSVISDKDDMVAVSRKYAKRNLINGDILVISERVVAITQGRMITIDSINPSVPAKLLVKFVYKPSWGIGIGSPETMEMAIREAGLMRILIAGLLGSIGKIFGLRGIFYLVAGSGVNAIDGPTEYTLPPGNRSATLGPKDPNGVADRISKEIGCPVVIIDANDIGQRVEGASLGIDRKLICKIFRDNPLGQSKEQTPMAIVRKI